MEVYNKQSLKTVQQHVSSLNMQVNKYRSVNIYLELQTKHKANFPQKINIIMQILPIKSIEYIAI